MIEIKYKYNGMNQKVYYIIQNDMILIYGIYYGFYNFHEIRNIVVNEVEWRKTTEIYDSLNRQLKHIISINDINELNSLENTHPELFI